MTQIKAHDDGQQIVFDEPVNLKPNTKLTILVEEAALQPDEKVPADNLLDIFGTPFSTGIKDWSEEHDHYLYGTPKKQLANK